MPSKALADSQRNQTPSPMDQTQRKPAAWARGSTNPLTQRPVGAAIANGVTGAPNKSNTPQKAAINASKESSSPDRQAHERLTFLLAQSQGLGCTITLRNGEKYTGIFSAALTDQSEPPRYLLKMVKKVANEGQANGAGDSSPTYNGTGPQYQKIFPVRDVVDLQVDGVQLNKNQAKSGQNGTSRFRTDADISSGFVTRERDLKPWDGGEDNTVDMSLEGGNNGKPWDQFEVNERLYGVTTNYDESFYTTTIDKSHPQYKEREAEALRLAREIESSTALNSHIIEERGLKTEDDPGEDEESKYSGVRRDYSPVSNSGPNKYLPPAMRRPTGQPTVSGAPVDPAIISSSLAKSEKPAVKNTKENEKPVTVSAAPSDTSTSPALPAVKTPSKEDTSKPAASKSALEKVLPAQAKLTSSSKDGGATATVEKDVVNAFKTFSATEKLRAREQQQQNQRRDKAVKLNDLKKFSQNFKLHTLVPDDLIPILAKEKDKQEEIVAKARKNFQEQKTTPVKASPKLAEAATASTTSEQKPPTKPATVRTTSSSATSINSNQPTGPADRNNQRPVNRQSPNFSQSVRGLENRPHQQIPSMPRNGTQFGQKLVTQYSNRQGPMTMQPQDPRVAPVPTGPAMSAIPSMPGAQAMHGMPSVPGAPSQGRLQYTAKIPEFKPNPAAHTFQPGTNSSGAASPIHQAPTPRPKIGNFFEGRRALLSAETRMILGSLNTITRLLDEAKDEPAAFHNGGIRKVFYPPVWDVPDERKDEKYTDLFEKAPLTGSTPPLVLPHHGMGPHGHQMHVPQGVPMPAGHTPQHTPRHHPVQPMMPNGPSHDDHRMQFSQSTSAVHPSPRPPPPYVANGYGPGSQPMPMYPQQMAYGMSPGAHPMTMRQVSGGPPFMPPSGPGMGGPVMTNQLSSGPYMNPQMQVYSPVPAQAYPHHNGHNPQQTPPGGFPSPRPTHMMAHSASQQGHPQQIVYVGNQHGPVYGQPPTGPMGPMRAPFAGPPPTHHYGSSPHQHHQFPQQMPRGTPSASYVQPMMPGNNHAMIPQVMPPAGPPMQAEAAEDVK